MYYQVMETVKALSDLWRCPSYLKMREEAKEEARQMRLVQAECLYAAQRLVG